MKTKMKSGWYINIDRNTNLYLCDKHYKHEIEKYNNKSKCEVSWYSLVEICTECRKIQLIK